MVKTAKTKILIVEDERATAIAIKENLRSFGYDSIEIVVSGEEAIQKAEAMHPDVVLMDIILKRGTLDGIEAAKVIKERLNIPIIYLTAYSDEKTVQRAKATKPVGYLLKPCKKKDLQLGIETALL